MPHCGSSFPTRWPRTTLAIAGAALAAAVSLIALRGLPTDNGVDRFMVRGDDSYERFISFRNEFGSGEHLLVALRLDGEPDAALLAELAALEEGLHTADHAVAARLGTQPFFAGILGVHQLPAVRALIARGAGGEVAELPLAGDLLLVGRPVARWTLLVAELRTGIASGDLGALLDEVERGLPAPPGPSHRIALAGDAALNVALDRASQDQASVLFPLLGFVSLALLWWLVRSLPAALLVAACAGSSILAALAGLAASGISLNMITTALPAVLMVLSSACCLHVLRAYGQARARGRDSPAAASQALAETLRPCGLASLTTAIGFLTLATSSVQPIREMGLFAALGIAVSFACAMTLLPAALVALRLELPADHHRHLPRHLRPRHPRRVLVVSGLLTLVAAAGTPALGIESAALGFLPRSHPLPRTHEMLERAGRGLTGVEVLVRAPENGRVPAIERLAALADLERELRAIPGVTACIGPPDAVALARAGPGSAPQSARVTAFLAGEPGHTTARLHLATLPHEVAALEVLLDAIGETCSTFERKHAGVRCTITGLGPIMIGLHGQLVRSQTVSLLLAILLVGLVMTLGLRSLRLALLGAVPNLVPLIFIYGFLGWVGIELDVATVMVGAIALGISVDDTVHVLSAWRTRRWRDRALMAALDRVWWPVLSTSVVAGCGFLVLAASDFAPMVRFGLVTAAVMVLALLCDLLLLPALLRLLGPVDSVVDGERAARPAG